MPVSKAQFIEAKNAWIQGKVEQIDKKLHDQMGNPYECDKHVDVIVGDDGFSDELKAMLRAQYQAVGWSDMDFRSSAENGERPGLMRVRLYF